MGVFRLTSPRGDRIDIPSRKGMALLAMLATAKEGERTRAWLHDRLWGSREIEQARGSLRRELSNLRRQLNVGSKVLLVCHRDRVRLDLDQIVIDVRNGQPSKPSRSALSPAEFLEGLDLPGEEGFEDWLREQRAALRDSAPSAASVTVPVDLDPTEALPARIVDVSRPAPGFSGRSALAVLPFLNLTGDPANDYLAEGLSEGLIDRLSRLRWLPVIARGSSFSVGSLESDAKAIGARLGARYLLEGRLRGPPAGFNLAVELVDAETRHVLSSRKVDLPSVFSTEFQQQLVSSLAGALDTRIDTALQTSARVSGRDEPNVDDLIWRGRWHVNRLTRWDAECARSLFAEALALDPESAEALIQATWALGRSIWAERGSPEQIDEMRVLAQKAIRVDPEDSRGHWLAGVAEMWRRHPARAIALFERAIALNPSSAEAHAQIGDTYAWNGQPEKAVESVRTALRLSPNDLLVFAMLSTMATAFWMMGRWTEAIDHAEQSIIRRPGYWYGFIVKINAFAGAGEWSLAKQAVRELYAIKPKFEPADIDWVPFVDRRWNQALKEGLIQASDRPDMTVAALHVVPRAASAP